MAISSRRRARILAGVLLLGSAWTAVPARGQTSYPMLTRVEPVAVRRGTNSEITIAGTQDYSGASRLLFEGTGLSGEVDSSAPGGKTSVKVRIAAAPEAELGPREIRVVTPQGVSSIGLVVVVADPVVREADDSSNDRPTSAQAVDLPAVICGKVGKTEDVDWYSFRAEAGQRVTFSVWGNRLENKIHDLQTHLDPILVLHAADGRELAADDNRLLADPLLSYTFRDAGTYLLEVRDTTYAGNANWTYAVHATSGPVAVAVTPLAVRSGETAELTIEGWNLGGETASSRMDVPADVPTGPRLFALPTERGLTLPVGLAVTRLPLGREDGDAPETIDQGQPLMMPVALTGRLGAANDVDVYRFEAVKGRVYAFEVTSRRLGSDTDPVLRIKDARGNARGEADDTFGKDPRLEWTAPADGTFAVEVRDLHSRGGSTFGYVLSAGEAKPDFVVTCDPDKINVGPGSRVPVFVKIERRGGFNGPITFSWEGLPPGLSSSPLTVPASMTQGVMTLSASDQAKLDAGLVRLKTRAETSNGPVEHDATPRQEIYLPGGGRGLYNAGTLAACITSPSDITVETKADTLQIAPGGTATLEVTVRRRAGFDKPVNLAVNLAHLGGVFGSPLPPGVTFKEAGSKTLLGPTETTGRIVLQAAPTANPIENVPIVVMGHVSINFVVKTAYASAPVWLSVMPK